MAEYDGEERVIATARHIVTTLGTTDTMTDDMLKILSKFDDRFSSMNELLPKKAESSTESPRMEGRGGEDVDLESVEKLVKQWDMASSDAAKLMMIWECSRDEAASYLQAVDDVQNLLASLSVSPSSSALQDHAQNLQQLAMARLEEEFRHMLQSHSDSLDPDWLTETLLGSTSNSAPQDVPEAASPHTSDDGEEDVPVALPVVDLQLDLLPPEVVADLGDIAHRMVAGGYGRECCYAYASVRKIVLEDSLFRLGVEKLSIDEVQRMTWDILEGKIRKWIQTMKVCVKVLFASEGRLCDQVFSGLDTSRDTCFTDLAKGAIMQLLNFSEAIANSHRTSQKLFRVLDMYETLRDLIPEIEATFTGEGCASVRSDAAGILIRLGEAARGAFAEFENAINRDTSRTPVPGGAVHPVTKYVMNYMRFVSDYTVTLKQLFSVQNDGSQSVEEEANNGGGNYLGDEDRAAANNETSPLALRTMSITRALEANLDVKSKLYKDVALTYLFQMNNVHYIVQKVRLSNVRVLLGDDWIRKHNSFVKQHATSYQRATWSKVLGFLRDEGIHTGASAASGVSRFVLKDRFKSFNIAFEEVHKVQSTWMVPDLQLRAELRISITHKLIPAYRAFYGRYKSYLETGRHPEKYIKFTSDDLEVYVNDLFEGSSGSMTLRRKSFSG